MNIVPEIVYDAFNIDRKLPIKVLNSKNTMFRLEEFVVSKVSDASKANWSSKIRENIFLENIQIAKPIRSLDGRFIVSNWRVDQYEEGTNLLNLEQNINVIKKINKSLSNIPKPEFLKRVPVAVKYNSDLIQLIDSIVFSNDPKFKLDQVYERTRKTKFKINLHAKILELFSLLKKINSSEQVISIDTFGSLLVGNKSKEPILKDIHPAFRPTNYSYCLIIIDFMLWSEESAINLDEYKSLIDFEQLLLRALISRLVYFLLNSNNFEQYQTRIDKVINLVRLDV